LQSIESAMQASAAVWIRERKQVIIDRWLDRVREHLEAAKSQNTAELIDSVPEILDRLATALESPDPERDLEPAQSWLGAEHGQHRAKVTAYSLEQLITEYRFLHEVVLESLDEGGGFDSRSRDLISHACFTGIGNAAGEFARLRNAALESELAATDTRFRHMVEAVKDYAIFTLDPKGNITTWNLGCMRMKRYTPEEAIGQHFSMLYPPEGQRRDEPMGHLRTAAIEGRFRGEGMRIRKGGELFLADVSITPIYEGGEVIGFTKVVQDLTERNVIMQERDLSREVSERLRAEAEARNRFIAAVTHDLRSPLAIARTGLEVVARQAGDAEKIKVLSEKIVTSLVRADRMIQDLLDASRLDAGESPALHFEHCDLEKITRDLLEDLRGRHGDRFRFERDGDTRGYWSPDGLRRVLDNLLSNAIKYGEPNQPITIRLRRVEDHMLLSVHNFGTIIPIQEQENLFKQFHRTPTAERSGQPGWGIGLTLVKGIAEAHGGMVKAESYPKEGTTFTVDLPVDGAAATHL
jgi:PAS domain S-box-containing protein